MQFLLKTLSKKFIKSEIKSIGFDCSHIDNAYYKHLFLSVKIFALQSPAANILKQTALSVGCDCAVHRGVIDCSVEKTDCILSGTYSQIINVAKKLSNQPFKLSRLKDDLLEFLENLKTEKPKTKIMGILNVTPNSFSDGGEFMALDKAINHAVDMIESGAQIIDIGAQSTYPNTPLVDSSFEIEKIIPIIIAIKNAFPNIQVSVDTMNIETVSNAIDAGCDIINDVSFLKDIEFIKLCAKSKKKLILTHTRGNSYTMDNLTCYENLIDDIYKSLSDKIDLIQSFSFDRNDIIIDPGFGFAKNYEQNFELLNRINEFKSLNCPILAGVSRKRFLQDVISTKEPKDADIQSILAASYLIQNDIDYIRVHNVKLTMEAIKFNENLNRKYTI